MRILTVDDEPSILDVLRALLEAENANVVVTANSGAEALAIIEAAEVDFDCILLDIQMPEMNGISLCQIIRQMPDYLHVPIIMLTAMSQKSYVEKAFAVGATDYVTKPFDFLELRSTLRAAAKVAHEFNCARDEAETARRLIRKLNVESKPPRDEPLSIEGVERVVGYTAFENFVMALSRTRLLFATALAIKIVDFPKIHEAASAREMRAILKTSAQAIVDQIQGPGNLVSYRGDGVFLCVNQKRTLVPEGGTSIPIPDPPYGNLSATAKLDVQLVVGPEVSLVAISKTGVFVALRKAVDLIDRLPIPSRELANLSKRVLRNQSRTQEQSNLSRRAYELFLEEVIREQSPGAN